MSATAREGRSGDQGCYAGPAYPALWISADAARLGHSRATHGAFGWCCLESDRTVDEEVWAWRLRHQRESQTLPAAVIEVAREFGATGTDEEVLRAVRVGDSDGSHDAEDRLLTLVCELLDTYDGLPQTLREDVEEQSPILAEVMRDLQNAATSGGTP